MKQIKECLSVCLGQIIERLDAKIDTNLKVMLASQEHLKEDIMTSPEAMKEGSLEKIEAMATAEESPSQSIKKSLWKKLLDRWMTNMETDM
jgi:predicted transcriptional regulator